MNLLHDKPNLQAVLDGRVSGDRTEWPVIRIELRQLLDEYESEKAAHAYTLMSLEHEIKLNDELREQIKNG